MDKAILTQNNKKPQKYLPIGILLLRQKEFFDYIILKKSMTKLSCHAFKLK